MAQGILGNVMRQLRLLAAPAEPQADADNVLLQQFLDTRDESAFAALVERHGGMVLGVCRRVLGNEADADDAFQAAFLTLARKAAAIRRQASVGSWLHGVAYRVARRARLLAERRRHHERQAAMNADASAPDHAASDLRPVIDAEMLRLPERLRAPLVLCYLEGQSRADAARALGCSVAVCRGRLERGREALRTRLARRGLTVTSAALGAVLAGEAAAAVPPALASAAVRSAVQQAAAPAVVLALSRGVMRELALSKLAMSVLALTALAGLAGVGAYRLGDARGPLEADAAASLVTPLDDDPAPRELIEGILAELPKTPAFSPTAAPSLQQMPLFLRRSLSGYERDPRATEGREAVVALIAVLDREPQRKVDWRGGPDQASRDAAALQGQLVASLLDQAEAFAALENVDASPAGEPSKRWRALCQYAKATALLRRVVSSEYNHALGQARKQALPAGTSWRLVFHEDLSEANNVRSLAQAHALLQGIIKDHPGTPYAVLAQRELAAKRGVSWEVVE